MVTVRWRCGHTGDVDPDKVASPVCACGERKIAGVLNVGAPRIVGHATGPLVEQKYLGPQAVRLAKRPLPLKEPTDGDQQPGV